MFVREIGREGEMMFVRAQSTNPQTHRYTDTQIYTNCTDTQTHTHTANCTDTMSETHTHRSASRSRAARNFLVIETTRCNNPVLWRCNNAVPTDTHIVSTNMCPKKPFFLLPLPFIFLSLSLSPSILSLSVELYPALALSLFRHAVMPQ